MTPASELILHPRGSIYHLDLRPEELADIVLTVGDPGRVPMISRYFDRIEFRAAHREFITHTGYIGRIRLSAVSTGIGPDNIDIVLNELDALANIDFGTRTMREQRKSLTIIRLGTSGALQPDIALDSMVASSYAIGLDNLMHFYRRDQNQEESRILREFSLHTGLDEGPVTPYISEGSKRLRHSFAGNMCSGITVTCPGFYGPQGRILHAPLAFPDLIHRLGTFSCGGHRVTNFEMETSAIYALGSLLGHHCLSISTIVANRVLGSFSSRADGAIERMIETVIERLAHPA